LAERGFGYENSYLDSRHAFSLINKFITPLDLSKLAPVARDTRNDPGAFNDGSPNRTIDLDTSQAVTAVALRLDAVLQRQGWTMDGGAWVVPASRGDEVYLLTSTSQAAIGDEILELSFSLLPVD